MLVVFFIDAVILDYHRYTYEIFRIIIGYNFCLSYNYYFFSELGV